MAQIGKNLNRAREEFADKAIERLSSNWDVLAKIRCNLVNEGGKLYVHFHIPGLISTTLSGLARIQVKVAFAEDYVKWIDSKKSGELATFAVHQETALILGHIYSDTFELSTKALGGLVGIVDIVGLCTEDDTYSDEFNNTPITGAGGAGVRVFRDVSTHPDGKTLTNARVKAFELSPAFVDKD